jgi:4'-phosphopantetheinyl transferase
MTAAGDNHGAAPPVCEISVHTVQLASMGLEGRARAVLSPAELDRADRFVRAADRRRYLLSHLLLRRVLAWHTGETPGRLVFGSGDYGKPYLEQWPHCRFSLSHAEEWALVAVTEGADIGADIEPVRAMSDRDALVARFFAAEERVAYERLPEAVRDDAFFAVWTRKEAYVKALGRGLWEPLDAFAVSLELAGDCRLLRGASGDWTLIDVSPRPGCRAAVAVACASDRVRLRVLEPIPASANEGAGWRDAE